MPYGKEREDLMREYGTLMQEAGKKNFDPNPKGVLFPMLHRESRDRNTEAGQKQLMEDIKSVKRRLGLP